MKQIITAILVLAAAQPALALQNIKIGGAAVHPFISVKQFYDSNIYLTPEPQRVVANINRTAFGVDAEKQFGSKLDLKAGYTMELLTYSVAPRTNNAVHNLANVALDAKLPRNSVLTLKDDFAQTTDQATSQTTPRAKRAQNTAGVSMDSPLRGKLGYGIDVQHTYNNYMEAAYDTLDRSELLAGFNINYKVQPKTKVFVGYTYGNLQYAHPVNEVSDSVYNNIDLGVTGNLAPKLVGTVKAGTQFRTYSQDKGTAANDITTGGYSAQVQWKPMDKTEVVLYGKRANVESQYGFSRFYTSTLTDISASREIRKFKVGVGVGYESVLYPERTVTILNVTTAKRLDHNTNARLMVDYNVQKWLKAGFNYTYKCRTSTDNKDAGGTLNYDDNIVGVELKGMF